MAWIKIRTELVNDPHVARMSVKLGISRQHVVGGLVAVWSAADQYTTDGHLSKVGAQYVDDAAGVELFSLAMKEVGWLKVARNGDLTFPDWTAHNGPTAKTRAQAARRQARARASEDVTHEAQHDRDGNGADRHADSAPTADKSRGRKEQQTTAEALLSAGVAEPVLSELIALGVTASQVDRTWDKLSRRGLGVGALVNQLRADAAAKTNRVRNKKETATTTKKTAPDGWPSAMSKNIGQRLRESWDALSDDRKKALIERAKRRPDIPALVLRDLGEDPETDRRLMSWILTDIRDHGV